MISIFEEAVQCFTNKVISIRFSTLLRRNSPLINLSTMHIRPRNHYISFIFNFRELLLCFFKRKIQSITTIFQIAIITPIVTNFKSRNADTHSIVSNTYSSRNFVFIFFQISQFLFDLFCSFSPLSFHLLVEIICYFLSFTFLTENFDS